MRYSKINNEYRITNEQITVSLVTVKGGFFLFLEGPKEHSNLPEVTDTVIKIFSADGDRVFSIDESKTFTEVMGSLGYPPPGTYMVTSKLVKIRDLTSKQEQFLQEGFPQAELMPGNKQVFIPRERITDLLNYIGIYFDVESPAQTQIYVSGPPPILGKEIETDQKFLEIELCKAASQGDIARIDQYLDYGADINCKESVSATAFFITTKKTPLMHAAENGRLEAVKHLVKNKADFTLTTGWLSPTTALTLAKENKHKEVAEFLVRCETLPLVIHWDEIDYDTLIERPEIQLLEHLEKIISFIKEHEEQYKEYAQLEAESIIQRIRNSLFLAIKYLCISSNKLLCDWLKANTVALSQRLAFLYWLDLKFNSLDMENQSTPKNYFVIGSYLSLINPQRNPNYSWTQTLLALVGGAAVAGVTTYSAIENNEIDFLLAGGVGGVLGGLITSQLYTYAKNFKANKQKEKLVKDWQQEKIELSAVNNAIAVLGQIRGELQIEDESIQSQPEVKKIICV